jgi:hypothetical protein
MIAVDTATKFLVVITSIVGVITAVTWVIDKRRERR